MSLQSQISSLATRVGQECKSLWTALSGKCSDTDPRLSDAREWTAEIISQAEAELGAGATPRKWTSSRVHQAILALAPGGVPNDSVTYEKINGTLKDRHQPWNSSISWSSAGIFIKIMGADTTFAFGALQLNKVITIIVTGNWVITWPSYMDADHFLGGDDYDGTVYNYFQVHCTNDAVGSEEVWWTCKAVGS